MRFIKKFFEKKLDTDNLESKENIFSSENVEHIQLIVSKYGKILEIHNDVCEPISILSNSKDDIKDALKTEFLFSEYLNNKGKPYTENDQKYKEGLSVCFISLANFMEDELSISYKRSFKTTNELIDPNSVKYSSIDDMKLFASNLVNVLELQKKEADSLSQEWSKWETSSNILNKINKE